MKITYRLFISTITLGICIGLSPLAMAQTSSVVSGNVPQDESRINQDIAQLHSDEFNGNTRAIPQDLAFLNAQQRILAQDQGSAQNFNRIQRQFNQTQRNFNNRNSNNNLNFSQPVSGFVNFSQQGSNNRSSQNRSSQNRSFQNNSFQNRSFQNGNRQLGPILGRSNNPNGGFNGNHQFMHNAFRHPGLSGNHQPGMHNSFGPHNGFNSHNGLNSRQPGGARHLNTPPLLGGATTPHSH